METPALITLIGTIVSATATVLLTGLTAWYVNLTHKLVQEAKSAKVPNVFVDLEFGPGDIKLIVGNSGSSPAFNIRFSVTDSIPWHKIGDSPTGISSLSIVKNGLKYLAPGRKLRFDAGNVEQNNPDFFAGSSDVSILLNYETENAEPITRNLTINLQAYSGVLYESFRNPEREVAEAIRETERQRSSREDLSSLSNRMFRKNCSSCGEKISSSARKCPHCHETFRPEST